MFCFDYTLFYKMSGFTPGPYGPGVFRLLIKKEWGK